MNEQTVQAVIDCLETVLKQAGIQTLEDAGTAIEKFADILNQARPYCTRDRLKEILRQIQITPEDERLIRGATENLGAIAVAVFEEALPLMRKEFLVVSGGRPKSLTSEQAKAACEHIGSLIAQGLDMKTAKQRAAQKFHVSMSTIERTWAERKNGHKPSAKEILGILKDKSNTKAKAASAGEATGNAPS